MQQDREKNLPDASVNDAELRQRLSPEEYYVTREAGTEPAFSGRYWNVKTAGVYACVCCGQELFHSDTKYDSGTGWPSFYKPITEAAVGRRPDRTLGARRTEVICSKCDAHLGHVFADGPRPTGERFCMNSLALKLREEDSER